MKPEFIENFLGKKEFNELQTIIMSDDFDWHYNDTIDYKGQKNKFQFIHMFYDCFRSTSLYGEYINPIIEIIDPVTLWRIKANLLTRTPNIVENEFHDDMGENISKERLKQWTTAIFYVNTNNGYTKFEDGTKVESVANRIVFFSSNMKHTGTSCTDEKRRIIINFNYYRK